MSDVTVMTVPPNSPEARTPTGDLKDQSPTTTPTQGDPKTSTEGNSFLTGKTEPKVEPKEGDTPKEGDQPKDAPKADAPIGAPEKYADFKLPDGYKFDAKELEKATGLFKANNLTQDQAQELVDFYAENALQATRAPYDAWANLQKEWSTEIISRFGDRTDQVRSDINKAIDAVLSPSLARNFRAALDLTGAGTNPDLVEGLSLLFRPHYEGTPVLGNGPTEPSQRAPGSGPKSIAEAIYPHLAQNRQ